jgi:hypothetical protein
VKRPALSEAAISIIVGVVAVILVGEFFYEKQKPIRFNERYVVTRVVGLGVALLTYGFIKLVKWSRRPKPKLPVRVKDES